MSMASHGVPLVGRDDELRVLTGMLERVGVRGGAVVVRGEAGIGKSALLAAASRLAAAGGLRVLRTAGVESETHVAFAGLQQLLRPVVGQVEMLPGPQRGAVSVALGRADAAAADLFLIALGTLSLVSEAATRAPVLLVVEDVQWLDRASADVLAFVARRLEFEPVISWKRLSIVDIRPVRSCWRWRRWRAGARRRCCMWACGTRGHCSPLTPTPRSCSRQRCGPI